jgi:serine/threonine-protein kinase
MRSDDPEDWHTGWNRYLRPLEEKYPEHPYREELGRFRRQIEEHEAQRQARRSGATAPISEGQWFYQQGLRLREQGDEATARRVWQNLTRAFADVPSEQAWVRQAEEQLQKPAAVTAKDRWTPVEEALDRACALRDEGKPAEAAAIWQSLEELYGSDPSAAPILARLRADRARRPQ